MSITDEWEESKGKAFFGRLRPLLLNIYVPLILIFIGITSFSLGRLSATYEKGSIGVRIIESVTKDTTASAREALETTKISNEASGSGEVVASKNGTVYYLPWCSQVSRIKPENLIRFASAHDARMQGYEPSTACKGTQ